MVVRPQEDKFKETAENPTTGSLVHFNAMTAAAFTRFSDDASRRGAFVERAVADPLNRAGIDWVGPDLTKRVGARSGPSLMGSKRRRF